MQTMKCEIWRRFIIMFLKIKTALLFLFIFLKVHYTQHTKYIQYCLIVECSSNVKICCMYSYYCSFALHSAQAFLIHYRRWSAHSATTCGCRRVSEASMCAPSQSRRRWCVCCPPRPALLLRLPVRSQLTRTDAQLLVVHCTVLETYRMQASPGLADVERFCLLFDDVQQLAIQTRRALLPALKRTPAWVHITCLISNCSPRHRCPLPFILVRII